MKFDPKEEINNTAYVQYIKNYEDDLVGYFIPNEVMENLLKNCFEKGSNSINKNMLIRDV